MVNQQSLDMAERKQKQTPVTLSPRIEGDYRTVAEYLGVPFATFLRQALEEYHRSDSFEKLLQKASKETNG